MSWTYKTEGPAWGILENLSAQGEAGGPPAAATPKEIEAMKAMVDAWPVDVDHVAFQVQRDDSRFALWIERVASPTAPNA